MLVWLISFRLIKMLVANKKTYLKINKLSLWVAISMRTIQSQHVKHRQPIYFLRIYKNKLSGLCPFAHAP